jgi:hypothetical protein
MFFAPANHVDQDLSPLERATGRYVAFYSLTILPFLGYYRKKQ